jgi:hypothetical protein
MTAFSVTDVALSGLRFSRNHPRTVVIWGALQLVMAVFGTALMINTLGPNMPAMSGTPRPDPAVVSALMGQMLAFYAVGLPLVLAYQAIAFSTACRAVFTPRDDRAAYLRLGKDELRQGLLILLGAVAFFGLDIAVTLVVMIPVVVLAVVAPAGMQSPLIVVLPLLVLAALAVFAVRLSVAGPLTYEGGKVKLWASWKLTRGHFWRMLGAYLLAFLLATVVGVLVSVVAFAVAALLGAGTDWVGFLFRPDFSSLSAYFTLPRIVFMTISAISGGLTLPLIYFPPVEIYRRLRQAKGLETAAVL